MARTLFSVLSEAHQRPRHLRDGHEPTFLSLPQSLTVVLGVCVAPLSPLVPDHRSSRFFHSPPFPPEINSQLCTLECTRRLNASTRGPRTHAASSAAHWLTPSLVPVHWLSQALGSVSQTTSAEVIPLLYCIGPPLLPSQGNWTALEQAPVPCK